MRSDENNEAEQKRWVKLLRAEVDDELTFITHIGSLSKRKSTKIGVIYRSRNKIPAKAKLTIHKRAISFHLTHRTSVGHFRKKHTKKKDRVQNKTPTTVYCEKFPASCKDPYQRKSVISP